MLEGLRLVVVLPAYNAERTLERTLAEIPRPEVDEVLLVDDASQDGTVALAQRLGLPVQVHPANRGYGANQRSCYRWALERGAELVVMLHPDYQYPPALVPALAAKVAQGDDIALGSRFLEGGAREGGMPLYKWLANRALTGLENRLLKRSLSEYHTGFRAYSRASLERLPLHKFDDGWAFDAQVLAWAAAAGWRIGELAVPTRYADDSSSIGPRDALSYGIDVVALSLQARLAMSGLRTGVFRIG